MVPLAGSLGDTAISLIMAIAVATSFGVIVGVVFGPTICRIARRLVGRFLW